MTRTEEGEVEEAEEVIIGEFVSILICVTPCRSDKSPHGVFPGAHLSDGRLHLVLVHKCRKRENLSFLIDMARRGIAEGRHKFVQIFNVRHVHVDPVNGTSSWNIDGENIAIQTLTATVHNGLLEVFARGVETSQ